MTVGAVVVFGLPGLVGDGEDLLCRREGIFFGPVGEDVSRHSHRLVDVLLALGGGRHHIRLGVPVRVREEAVRVGVGRAQDGEYERRVEDFLQGRVYLLDCGGVVDCVKLARLMRHNVASDNDHIDLGVIGYSFFFELYQHLSHGF